MLVLVPFVDLVLSSGEQKMFCYQMFSFQTTIHSFVSLFQEVCFSKIPLTAALLFVVRADEGEASDPKYREARAGADVGVISLESAEVAHVGLEAEF